MGRTAAALATTQRAGNTSACFINKLETNCSQFIPLYLLCTSILISVVLHGEDALKIALGKNVRSVQLASKSTNLRPGTQKTFGRKNTERCLFFWKCLRWSSRKAVSVPTYVIGGLRGSTATSPLLAESPPSLLHPIWLSTSSHPRLGGAGIPCHRQPELCWSQTSEIEWRLSPFMAPRQQLTSHSPSGREVNKLCVVLGLSQEAVQGKVWVQRLRCCSVCRKVLRLLSHIRGCLALFPSVLYFSSPESDQSTFLLTSPLCKLFACTFAHFLLSFHHTPCTKLRFLSYQLNLADNAFIRKKASQVELLFSMLYTGITLSSQSFSGCFLWMARTKLGDFLISYTLDLICFMQNFVWFYKFVW